MSRPRDEEGVVLLLVLVIVVLTVSTVYAFARTSLLSVQAQRHRADRVRAELLARSGVDIALRTLADDTVGQSDPATLGLDTNLDSWALLSRTSLELPGGGELRIRVTDAGNRINLNALVDDTGRPHADSRAFLIAALERILDQQPGRPEDAAGDPEIAADAILDYLDNDDRTRLGDDEVVYYQRRGGSAPPPDSPLFDLAELEDSGALEPELLEAMRAYFTVQPLFPDLASSGVNPNTAPPHVLSLIYQGTAGDKRLLNEDDVFAILRARNEGRIFCPQSTEDPCVSYESEVGRVGETVFPPLAFSADVFEIRSEARYFDSRACVSTIVDRAEGSTPTTLSYRMDC